MTIIYLTRHGETEWNTENRLQGWKDSPLTAKGRQHAKQLGQRLQDTTFQAVYSSPSERTFETAQLICEGRTVAIQTDVRLKEIHLGEWEGKTHDCLKQSDAEAYTAFWETPHLYISKTGENFEVLQNRLVEFLKEIQVKHPEEMVLIVTHGIAIKVLLSHFKRTGIEELWKSSFIHGTSLTIVESTEQGDIILMEGDMDHVKQDVSV